MRDLQAWQKFRQTGKIQDYLDYLSIHRACIADINRQFQHGAIGGELGEEKEENSPRFF